MQKYTICDAIFERRMNQMSELNERIREYRTRMHLSQDYVASYLGINRAAVTQIESGNRKVSADELASLSTLFNVSADTLLHGTRVNGPAVLFARNFERLTEQDQAEIINLMQFKERIREQTGK